MNVKSKLFVASYQVVKVFFLPKPSLPSQNPICPIRTSRDILVVPPRIQITFDSVHEPFFVQVWQVTTFPVNHNRLCNAAAGGLEARAGVSTFGKVCLAVCSARLWRALLEIDRFTHLARLESYHCMLSKAIHPIFCINRL